MQQRFVLAGGGGRAGRKIGGIDPVSKAAARSPGPQTEAV